MIKITIQKLKESNFNYCSLDDFMLKQSVSECWRKNGDVYKLTKVNYTEDWDLNKRRSIARQIAELIKNDGAAFGAFCRNKIIGFALIDPLFFGSAKQYLDLAMLYVSLPYRRHGIGRQLFRAACDEAILRGAKKLYISAHSAKESAAAYFNYGCTFAEEINSLLIEKEPFDLQLEFDLLKKL